MDEDIEKLPAEIKMSMLRIQTSRLLGVDKKLQSRTIGKMISGLLLPANVLYLRTEQDPTAAHRMLRISLRLANHRREKGEYPKSIELLKATSLGSLLDPYGAATLRYQNLRDGYRLYSLGGNGEDEDGVADWMSEGPRDDVQLSTHVPSQ